MKNCHKMTNLVMGITIWPIAVIRNVYCEMTYVVEQSTLVVYHFCHVPIPEVRHKQESEDAKHLLVELHSVLSRREEEKENYEAGEEKTARRRRAGEIPGDALREHQWIGA